MTLRRMMGVATQPPTFMEFGAAGSWGYWTGSQTSVAVPKPSYSAGDILVIWACGSYWPTDDIPDTGQGANWTSMQYGDYNRAFIRVATNTSADDFDMTFDMPWCAAQCAAFTVYGGRDQISLVGGGSLGDASSVTNEWNSSTMSDYGSDQTLHVRWTMKRNNSGAITPNGVTSNIGDMHGTIGTYYNFVTSPSRDNFWLCWHYRINPNANPGAVANTDQTESPNASGVSDSFYGRLIRVTI